MHNPITSTDDHNADVARIGDEIFIARDALLEIQTSRRAPRTWVFVPRGTPARLVARNEGVARVVIGAGPYVRQVMYVGDPTVTRRGYRIGAH